MEVQKQNNSLYIKEDNVSYDEYNNDNQRDVVFIALNQDENSTE